MTNLLEQLKQKSNPLLAQEQFKKSFEKNNYDDNTFWKPTKNATGTAEAIIRFLPIYDLELLKNGEVKKLPSMVEFFDHFCKTQTGKYYIENSLTTFGETDYIGEYIRELWQLAKTDPEMAQLARAYKRRRNLVANILVIEDKENPEAVGKVFKYRFGTMVFDKIKEKILPEFESEEAVDVFDLQNGANFKLRITKKSGYDTYEKSTFESPSSIIKTADDLIRIQEQIHDISYLVDRDKSYKTHEELKKIFIDRFGSDLVAQMKGEVSTPAVAVQSTPTFDEDIVMESAQALAQAENSNEDSTDALRSVFS